MIHVGKHYLKHPDSFAATNGVMEHPAGTPVGDFNAHMQAWCRRVLGASDVPTEYAVIARTLMGFDSAKVMFTPKNDAVIMTITVDGDERFRGPVFYVRDDTDWFGIGVRMACSVARGPVP